MIKKSKHLYIHIPFCQQICHYCNFHKHLASKINGFNQYEFITNGILKEAQIYLEKNMLHSNLKTIYLGGGTPSLLSISTLKYFLTQLKNIFKLQNTEFTIEADPMTFGYNKAKMLQDLGINRISFGAQSFSDKTLKILGRSHRKKHIIKSIEILRQIGFDNISMDLILGTPLETEKEWRNSLSECINHIPEHISVYILTYEQDTEFYKKYISNQINNKENKLALEKKERFLYDEMVNVLTTNNYDQYEVSNFSLIKKNTNVNSKQSKKSYESEHNKAYWLGKSYIGIGPSACSSIGNKRWKNISDTNLYMTGLQNNKILKQENETLSKSSLNVEKISLLLRTKWGINLNKILNNKTNNKINDLLNLNMIEILNNKLRIKQDKFALSDSIISELI